MQDPTPPTDPTPIDADDALRAERQALADTGEPLAALCLSGGGIRSAAFCLGVVQGLARLGVLKRFHYLSTVSGGGYTGAYLSARMLALELEARNPPNDSTDRSETLRKGDIAGALQAELRQGGNAPWLTRLRQSGNFLTPQMGLFSLDTWTGLTLLTRNLLLTWASLLPWVMLIALGFIAYRTLIAVAGAVHGLAYAALIAGAASLALSTYWLCTGLPSHHRDNAGNPVGQPSASPTASMVAIVAMLWPMLVPFALGTWETPPGWPEPQACPVQAVSACAWVAAPKPSSPESTFNRPIENLAALWLAGFYIVCVAGGYAVAGAAARSSPQVRRRYWQNAVPWGFATLFSALLTAIGPWLLQTLPDKHQVQVLAVAGPAWFALAMIVHAGTFMGLRRSAPAVTAELDREWTARMSARIQRISIAVALIAVPVLVLPDWIIPKDNAGWSGTGAWRTLLTPLLSGPAVAWLGHQAFTRLTALNDLDAGWRDKAWDLGLAIAAAVFIAFVLALSSAIIQSYILGPLQLGITRTDEASSGLWGFVAQAWHRIITWQQVPVCPPAPEPSSWCFQQAMLRNDPPAACCRITVVPMGLMLGLQAALAGVLLLAARYLCVDNNRFTLHALYRNRLVHGFLGPAREKNDRKPDHVTGFDPQDDVRLAAMRPAGSDQGTRKPLFPVINIAVNVTRTDNVQWAERKALSFTATPLHCGYFLPDGSTDKSRNTYVPTSSFNHSLRGEQEQAQGTGLGLGTAITLSGAAASPNAGYHSRPATALLMTLFNLRLGLWAPNPRPPAKPPGSTPQADPAADNPPPTSRAEKVTAAAKEAAARAAAAVTRGYEATLHVLSPTTRQRPIPGGLTPAEQRRALLDDLLGNSSIDGRTIYLSDGGHFDNLGLYEMLRRRCRLIVVVDAAHDPECGFADLGQSLRKAAIDLGATVAITATRIGSRKGGADNTGLLGFAVGDITYPETPDRPTGKLLYIKPTWLSELPMDVRAYGAAEKDFPQQATSDQWFSESQFESYRSLGTHQLQCLARKDGRDLTLEKLFRRARARLRVAKP